MSRDGDEVTVTLPRDRAFYPIAHLVLGGVGTRLSLTVDHLEDLRLALDGLLDRSDREGPVTLALRIVGDTLQASVGPFAAGLRGELEEQGDGDVNLRRLLDTVVDGVRLSEREGGDWVELTKSVRAEV